MEAYHEVSPDVVESVLKNGLKRDDRGVKGDDGDIIKTDKLLDSCCPNKLQSKGVSRQNNLYAYASKNGCVVSIVDGAVVPIDEFVRNSSQAVLRLKIDSKRCFVSDLDTYDALKMAVEEHKNQHVLEVLAKSYWSKVVPMERYSARVYRRPEIMVTYDLPASNVSKV